MQAVTGNSELLGQVRRMAAFLLMGTALFAIPLIVDRSGIAGETKQGSALVISIETDRGPAMSPSRTIIVRNQDIQNTQALARPVSATEMTGALARPGVIIVAAR